MVSESWGTSSQLFGNRTWGLHGPRAEGGLQLLRVQAERVAQRRTPRQAPFAQKVFRLNWGVKGGDPKMGTEPPKAHTHKHTFGSQRSGRMWSSRATARPPTPPSWSSGPGRSRCLSRRRL